MADNPPTALTEEPQPAECPFQKRFPPRQRTLPTIPPVIVADAFICDLKAQHNAQGQIILTLGVGCDYVGNEGRCPLRKNALAALGLSS
jgi:hypothetical protein